MALTLLGMRLRGHQGREADGNWAEHGRSSRQAQGQAASSPSTTGLHAWLPGGFLAAALCPAYILLRHAKGVSAVLL